MKSNFKRLLSVAAVAVSLGVSGAAEAIDAMALPSAPPAGATPAAPEAAFKAGQDVYIRDAIEGLKKSGHEADTQAYCLPPGSWVRIVSDDNRGGTNTVVMSIDKPGSAGCTGEAAQKGYSMVVVETTLLATDYSTQEWVSGILAVPFKFHLGDHSTTAGSTIGGYAGKRFAYLGGGSIIPVVSAGLAIVDSSPAQAGSGAAATTTDSSKTLTGVTAALGMISTIGSTKAQAGVLIGWDYVGRSAQYKYEAKPWISFEIGYSFLGSAK